MTAPPRAGGWVLRRYLDRLEIDRPGDPDPDGLRRLHRRHLERVPFENLSIHLGEPLLLDEVELVAKIVLRRRGGFCYELNGAFAWLLRAIGYRVDLLEAGVFTPEGLPGPRFDHLVLRVHLDEPWLVDVGFGDSHAEPLLIRTGVDQMDPNGVFRLVPGPGNGDGDTLDLVREGKPQYRFGLRSRALSDFDEMCRFHRTSSDSHFTRDTVCSLLTPRGRVTVSGRTLIVTEDGARSERDLDDAELLECYRETFGLHLPRLPRRPADGGAA